MLGIRGHSEGGITGILPPILDILDTDLYGRTLFSYSESAMMGGHTLFISQTSDESYAYFYFLDNFHSFTDDEMTSYANREYEWWDVNHWPEHIVAELKERNSWNQPINHDRLTRVGISHRKPDPRPVSDQQITLIYGAVFEDDAFVRPLDRVILFAIDDHGRSIHAGFGARNLRYIVMLFNPDESINMDTGIMEILDPHNYRDQLREFMQQNNWNMPLE